MHKFMKNIIAVLGAMALIMAPTAASATELNSDTGFNTPSAWMNDPSSPNLWTVSGGKANGNGATNMQMLMQSNSLIKAGHKYRWQLDVANRTAGAVKVGIGLTMTGSVTFSPLSAPLSPISDTFTTSLGLTSLPPHGSGDAGVGEVRSSFRMFCSAGQHRNDDPVVYPGLRGRSHLHRFFGNFDARYDSTYSTLRTTGMTTCGSIDPYHPINRSAYWHPDMLDGTGNSIQPNIYNLYYKTFPDTSDECANPSSSNYLPGAGGHCVNIPTGLRMIMGWNSATGLGGPADGDTAVVHWECWERTTNPGNLTIHGPYRHLRDLFGSGSAPCPLNTSNPFNNSTVGMFISFPTCWDGTRLDSSDHRSHLAYASIPKPFGWSACDDAHPYLIPSIEIQFHWEVDANFVAGKWRLSSDEMSSAAATDPGMTFHTDYMMGWSQPSFDQIFISCFRPLNSCSGGDLGNGTGIKGGGQTATSNQAGDGPDGHPINTMRYEPTSDAGIGPPISSNGTFSGEIVAAADGKFSLMAIEGFNGQVDNFSLQDITTGAKGPVTVHN